MFSKACEYGIRSAIYLAGQTMLDRKVSLKEISNAIKSPEAYTSKILQQLSRKKVIQSEKGPSGGFYIEKKKLELVKLSDIVLAIDGNSTYTGCGMGLKKCNEKKPCPVHDEFQKIREDLKEMLETKGIKGMALAHQDGLTFLKR